MPRKWGRTMRLVCVTALTAGAVAAVPGAAFAATCPDTVTSQSFARWGDNAEYSVAPGGSFESSLSWAETGSPVLVDQNNPFNVSGLGLTSVRLQGTQTITSPTVCVSELHPFMRFVAVAEDDSSKLVLEVLYNDKGKSKSKVLTEGHANNWREWAPSKLVKLAAELPKVKDDVHQVNLRFRLKDGRGSWLVDDVLIDPLRRR